MIVTDQSYVLLPPHRPDSLDTALFNKVCAALATRFDVSLSTIRPRLEKAKISMWGKIRCANGGDTIHASTLVTMGDDRRDASYVRVSKLYYC